MLSLRPYQTDVKRAIYAAWFAGALNVLASMATGSGKTVLFSDIMREQNRPTCAIAHRQELVGQISMSLAKFGLRHRIIAPPNVIRTITKMQQDEFNGRTFYDPQAPHAVAGVGTLTSIKRANEHRAWREQVGLWVIDEGHHVLRSNQWGKAVDLFPNARGLGVTATPLRADGKGLGSHAAGVFDSLCEGPAMRELINQGHLSDYRIYAPPSDWDFSAVPVTSSGDYSTPKLVSTAKESHIVGDVVAHYLRIAPGKLGVTFAVDVDTATDIAARFNAAGVPAVIISAKTPLKDRAEMLRRFARREILQVVNVDLFGEGFDLPALEVVSMARPTESYGLYCQQFGRSLRVLAGKDKAIIIDHVGNVLRHGLPDAPRVWSLDSRERTASAGEAGPKMRTCLTCFAMYEAVLKQCPDCGEIYAPAERGTPDQVDGDLYELDPAVLAQLRGEILRISEDPADLRARMVAAGAPIKTTVMAVSQHRKRLEMHKGLRAALDLWKAQHAAAGWTVDASMRGFYSKFKIDVATAQTLGRRETEILRNRVNAALFGGV